MPCVGCLHWTPPRYLMEPGKGREKRKTGLCKLDDKISHPYYHCGRYESPTGGELDTMGLTDEEVVWLRLNDWAPAAARLIDLYQIARSCPGDPRARAPFDIALRNWRARAVGKAGRRG